MSSPSGHLHAAAVAAAAAAAAGAGLLVAQELHLPPLLPALAAERSVPSLLLVRPFQICGRYDNMVNEYAALLEPDPRKFYHYLVVLPAVDRNQVIGDQVRGRV